MKTVFFGSPAISADLLEILLKNKKIEIVLVVTQPDKPVGKRLEITPTQVKKTALKYNLPIFDGKIRDKATLQELNSLISKANIELGILYAYGALIPENLIDLFPQGIWNVHPSLLPVYRGPAPTAYPLLLGDKITGVTIMKLVKKLDAGPIINQVEIPILNNSTRDSLEQQLTQKGAQLIQESIKSIEKAVMTTYEQDASKSTYTRLLKKEDGYISSNLIRQAMSDDNSIVKNLPDILNDYLSKYNVQNKYTAAEIIYDMFRAFNPWPGIWTIVNTSHGEKRLKLNNITFQDNRLFITDVQLEGKSQVDFKTFNTAYNFV